LLRLTGLAVLVFLVFRFRSGSYENNGSLIAGWWELPGLAGWGYLAAAITFISFRNSILGNLLIFLLFLTLNVLKYTGLSDFFEPVRPYFGVLLDGFIPSLVIAGSLAGIIIRKYSVNEALKPILIFSITAIFMAAAGYFLAVSYFGDGVYANPAYVLISCALTLILFLPLFLVVDIKGFLKQGTILKKTGANLFMTYIVHMLLLNLAALLYDDLFKILQTGNLLYNTIFSIVWVLVVTGVTALLIRFSIRLKF
jgi:hypothetical protein